MPEELEQRIQQPSRIRMVASAIALVLIVIGVWKVIDYRTQPPPPPYPIGAAPAPINP